MLSTSTKIRVRVQPNRSMRVDSLWSPISTVGSLIAKVLRPTQINARMLRMDDESDFRPEPQPPNKVRQRLTEHLERALPCSILYEHGEEVCDVECFVASVHSDFIILGCITQACHLDGWRALRQPAVIRVDSTEDAGFTLRAMKANAVTLPIKSPLACESFHEFLNKVGDVFNIVTTDDDPTLTHPSAAGTIVRVGPQSLTMRVSVANSTEAWGFQPHGSTKRGLR